MIPRSMDQWWKEYWNDNRKRGHTVGWILGVSNRNNGKIIAYVIGVYRK